MKRVLITGASGFVGARLLKDLASRYDAVGARGAQPGDGLLPLDLSDPASIRAVFDEARPDAVIHCAAMADPDSCERDPDRANLVNARAPGLIAELCARRGARLIHLSTDLVFDGTAAPYAESDRTAPLSVYGRAKLEAERAVLAACPPAAVVRVALVYGRSSAGRPSFLDWLLAELAGGRRPKLFVDQWRTPTAVSQLAEVFARLIERPDVSGVFHWAGSDRVSRLDFGRAACRSFGFPESQLEPSRAADHRFAAARPADVSLRCEALPRLLGLSPAGLEAGLSAER